MWAYRRHLRQGVAPLVHQQRLYLSEVSHLFGSLYLARIAAERPSRETKQVSQTTATAARPGESDSDNEPEAPGTHELRQSSRACPNCFTVLRHEHRLPSQEELEELGGVDKEGAIAYESSKERSDENTTFHYQKLGDDFPTYYEKSWSQANTDTTTGHRGTERYCTECGVILDGVGINHLSKVEAVLAVKEFSERLRKQGIVLNWLCLAESVRKQKTNENDDGGGNKPFEVFAIAEDAATKKAGGSPSRWDRTPGKEAVPGKTGVDLHEASRELRYKTCYDPVAGAELLERAVPKHYPDGEIPENLQHHYRCRICDEKKCAEVTGNPGDIDEEDESHEKILDHHFSEHTIPELIEAVNGFKITESEYKTKS